MGNAKPWPALELVANTKRCASSRAGLCLYPPLGDASIARFVQGYVFLEADGAVSSIVVGGANAMWPAEDEGGAWYADLVRGAGVLLLQREVPEHVNAALAAAAAAAGVPVMQDMGGEDRPIADALLPLITYLTLNETELDRLTQMPTATEQEVVWPSCSGANGRRLQRWRKEPVVGLCLR